MKHIPTSVRGTSVAALLLGGLLLGACEKAGNEPGAPSNKGHMTGKVTDAKGKPIKGATIIADNTLIYDSNAEGVSGEDGTYRIQTPGNFTYRAYAEIKRNYNGRHYRLELKPNEEGAFAGEEGAVRDFEWVLSGKIEDEPGLHYGGTVYADEAVMSQLYDGENVEFTFTPVGSLIDGSTGQVIKRRLDPDYNNELRDIPIGKYKITAVHKPTGKALKVRERRNGEYTADGSVTLDFYGEESPLTCNNCMSIEYSQ
jgi:hypothetical protein